MSISMQKYLDVFQCQHQPPYSLYCNLNHDSQSPVKVCWEANGVSSRLIEKQMTGKQVTGILKNSNVPHDSCDFGRCFELLNTHPDWISRLGEMTKYGINWQRLILRWTECTHLYQQQQFEQLGFLLRHIQQDSGLLKIYNPPTNLDFIVKSDLSIACLVPRNGQQDEYDIYPVAIVEPPHHGTKNSESVGLETISTLEPTEIQKNIHQSINQYIQNNIKTWQSSVYHKCHHVIIPSNEPSHELFVANVYSILSNQQCGSHLGFCVISIPIQHLLHPSNLTSQPNHKNLIKFNQSYWQVSSHPVKTETFYKDGLINC